MTRFDRESVLRIIYRVDDRTDNPAGAVCMHGTVLRLGLSYCHVIECEPSVFIQTYSWSIHCVQLKSKDIYQVSVDCDRISWMNATMNTSQRRCTQGDTTLHELQNSRVTGAGS